jgi:glycosyltransferase involved in cell wall biosynthesis
MSGDPKVSAIIPTYNRALLVGAAIESVRRQTYRNVEIIIVDDGSTDDTQQRLQAYGDAIRVIRQENAGPSAARNRGVDAARGEIVSFLDSDDEWEPTKLERQIDVFRKTAGSIVCCLCNGTIVSPSGGRVSAFDYAGLAPRFAEGVWANPAEILLTRFVMFTQMVAIRRDAVLAIGGFDESLRYMEDYDLALRLSFEGAWGYISEALVVYRQGVPDSLASEAHADEERLLGCALQARRRARAILQTSSRHSHLVRLSRSGVRGLEREQRALDWRRTSGLWSCAGSVALRLERYRRALYRRSPWYPSMAVSPIERGARLRHGGTGALRDREVPNEEWMDG